MAKLNELGKDTPYIRATLMQLRDVLTLLELDYKPSQRDWPALVARTVDMLRNPECWCFLVEGRGLVLAWCRAADCTFEPEVYVSNLFVANEPDIPCASALASSVYALAASIVASRIVFERKVNIPNALLRHMGAEVVQHQYEIRMV